MFGEIDHKFFANPYVVEVAFRRELAEIEKAASVGGLLKNMGKLLRVGSGKSDDVARAFSSAPKSNPLLQGAAQTKSVNRTGAAVQPGASMGNNAVGRNFGVDPRRPMNMASLRDMQPQQVARLGAAGAGAAGLAGVGAGMAMSPRRKRTVVIHRS